MFSEKYFPFKQTDPKSEPLTVQDREELAAPAGQRTVPSLGINFFKNCASTLINCKCDFTNKNKMFLLGFRDMKIFAFIPNNLMKANIMCPEVL